MPFFSLAVFLCSLLTTANAICDYNFELHIVNENAANTVCTDAEYDDLSNRALPTILAVLADPKYDLKPTKESDWKISTSKRALNRKEWQLLCSPACCAYCSDPILRVRYCSGCSCRMLRSERELSDIEVLEIRSNTEGAIRGLLNKFANVSPYSANCINAVIGATIGSTLSIV